MKKWYEGLTAEEIIKDLSRVAHNAGACAIHNEMEECNKLEKEFSKMFTEAIEAIAEVKTEYWAYRHHNDVYDTWDKAMTDAWVIRRGMENTILEAGLKYNW